MNAHLRMCFPCTVGEEKEWKGWLQYGSQITTIFLRSLKVLSVLDLKLQIG